MWVKYFAPSGRSSWFWVPSQLWDWCAGVSLWQEHVSAFPSCFSVAFLLFAQCKVVIPPVFSFSSLEIVSYVAVDLMCLWKVASSRFFCVYFTILKWNLYFHQHFKEIAPLLYDFHISEEKSVNIVSLISLSREDFFWSLIFISLHITYLNVAKWVDFKRSHGLF